MPQLRPITGFIIFLFVILSLIISVSSIRKKQPLVKNEKLNTLYKSSFKFFN